MHKWRDFNRYEEVNRRLPDTGEGGNMAEQASTAVCKLVYKWFNDGDVYDNTYALSGWANDLSSYANWLYANIPGGEVKRILKRIEKVSCDDDYTDLLYDLAAYVDGVIQKLEAWPKSGSVYDCEGPFKFNEDGEEW